MIHESCQIDYGSKCYLDVIKFNKMSSRWDSDIVHLEQHPREAEERVEQERQQAEQERRRAEDE
jgi:hypothetical protein